MKIFFYAQQNLPVDSSGKLYFKNLLEGVEQKEGLYMLPYWHYGFIDETKRRLDSVETAMRTNKDYKLISDYCWLKIKLGKVNEVLPTLQQLYKQYPNDYNIIANLGTAYELIGNNKLALELIQKAVDINPQSHFGSEWLHVNLLKAKIENLDYPNFLNYTINTHNYNDWMYNVKLSNTEMDSVIKNIAYQLHERMHFVKPQDKYVATLLLHFADLVAKRYSIKEAMPFFNQAVLFDKNLDRFINKRFFTYTPTLEKIEIKKSGIPPFYLLLSFVIGVGLTYFFARKNLM
jgi:tetratricopeptide (TPR) repeat protein